MARVAFAALVVATFAAFFVTQRLKRTPAVVQSVTGRGLFSPNGDGRLDDVTIAFRVMRSGGVTVDALNADGDRVRRLAESREVAAGRRTRVRWDGRDDAGRVVPDGTYRLRVALLGEGRSVVLPKRIATDTAPPRPRVLSVGPGEGRTAELLPNRAGEPARVRFLLPGRAPHLLLYRTDVTPARLVFERDLRPDERVWRWNGLLGGRLAPAGTYLPVARTRDRAGNEGSSPRPPGPRASFGATLPGRGGITVRPLAAQPPTVPVRSGGRLEVGVIAAGRPYAWAVRRVGDPRPRSEGTGTRARISARAPGGASGLYLFELRADGRTASVPFAIDAPDDHPVLVVLPTTTWQGRNPVDDDGDGLPDTLERGRPVRTARPYATPGLPAGMTEREAPLLVHLDRTRRAYDLTTDLALARDRGPRLEGHRGVVLAGETRWFDASVQRELRRFVRRGGRLLVTGPDSLRRTVTVTPERAQRPSPPTPRDLFGAALRPVERRPGLSLTTTRDAIGLFRGTEGRFGGLEAFEALASPGPEGRVVAAASTEDGRRDVITATRFGRGLVLRTGLPALPTRLGADPELRALVTSTWALLAGRG